MTDDSDGDSESRMFLSLRKTFRTPIPTPKVCSRRVPIVGKGLGAFFSSCGLTIYHSSTGPERACIILREDETEQAA